MGEDPVIGFVLMGVGVLFLLIGLRLFMRILRFLARSVTTQATVVDIDVTDSDGLSYSPVLRFTTADGRSVQFVHQYGHDEVRWEIGELMRVVYDPDDPDDARLDTFAGRYLGTIVTTSIGLVFLGVGAAIAFVPPTLE